MIDIDSLLDYYANLLIVQYHDKPKAIATVKALIKQSFNSDILSQIQESFNIDTALGKQLDILGKYIGINRVIAFSVIDPNNNSFSAFEDGGNNLAIINDEDFLIQNFNTSLAVNTTMSDEQYRFCLQLKIIQNYTDHSYKSIYDSIYAVFGTDVQPMISGIMAMSYYVTDAQLVLAQIAFKKGVLPNPAGVGFGFLIRKQPDKKFFGYAVNGVVSANVIGYSSGVTDFFVKEKYLTTNDLIFLT